MPSERRLLPAAAAIQTRARGGGEGPAVHAIQWLLEIHPTTQIIQRASDSG